MAILIFEHGSPSGAERLGVTLRDYGQKLRIIRPVHGDSIPPDLDNVDGIISCGGPQSAYDDSLDWLEPQMQLIRTAHEIEMPVLGICLGCQILARALGGRVEKNPKGIEFGWHEINLTPAGREDSLHTGLPWTSMQFHHHRDHVAELPPGARLLASSEKCKVQAWSIGLRSYGFQHHPEVTINTIESWMRSEPEALQESNLSAEDLRRETQHLYPAFERLSRRLFESIALFLMPVDRRYEGIVKELHH